MIQTLTKPLTLEQFLQLPETKPAREYIEGQIRQKPMPKGKHSTIQIELASLINYTLKKNRLGRAFTELRCTFGERSIVPDIAVFQRSKIPRDENGTISDNFFLAPDWTIEILSPEQSQVQVTKNILHCLKYGSELGWLIDPREEAILVYHPPQTIAVYDQAKTPLTLPSFTQDFQLTVGDIFAWLLD
jgi:Uma2 family endonuclease